MRIRVGILGGNARWESLLKQEGIPWSIVEDNFFCDAWSAMIVGDASESSSLNGVVEYLSRGGAVLCTGKVFSRFSGLPFTETFIRTLHEEPASAFAGIGLVDIFGKCQIPPQAGALRTERGRPAVFIGDHRGGHVVVLPFDPSQCLYDRRIAT